MKEILASWKTTAAAVILVALTVAYGFGKMTTDQYLAASFSVVALGLGMANDAGKK